VRDPVAIRLDGLALGHQLLEAGERALRALAEREVAERLLVACPVVAALGERDVVRHERAGDRMWICGHRDQGRVAVTRDEEHGGEGGGERGEGRRGDERGAAHPYMVPRFCCG
jgi:hypothetical protein